MNALEASFGFTISNEGSSLELTAQPHFRFYVTGGNQSLGEELSGRQIDLLRIGVALQVADSWAKRHAETNGHRQPCIDVEVLDAKFWLQNDTHNLLKECVDFVGGDDDWSFRFRQSSHAYTHRTQSLFRYNEDSAVVALYSGGLDSAAGRAVRLSEAQGQTVVPVNVRHQMQKGKLVGSHYDLLLESGLSTKSDLKPFQAAVFVKNSDIKKAFGASFRENSHRCRPLLFMALAGLVADFYNSDKVEVFESGVGSVNLPLVSGAADYHTTRSSHPNFLRLISNLVSHVNNGSVRYVLPFASFTKAEMVGRAKRLGMENLARRSVSCITHPLRRLGGDQCGYCPACVYRRYAMMTADIPEDRGAYGFDVFSAPIPFQRVSGSWVAPIRAFRQQIARLSELDRGRIPSSLKTYLYATHAVKTDAELAPFVEVHRRYVREWLSLIAHARGRRIPWFASPRSIAQGAIP